MKLHSLYFLSFILLLISSCAYTERQFHSSNSSRTSSQQGQIEDGELLSSANSPVVPEAVPLPTVPGVTPPSGVQTAPNAAIAPVENINARYKIALLVPLTGKSASVGKSLFDAAQMAVFESGNKDFQIVPFDTGDTAATTAAAAEAAVNSNVNIILGPVFSDKVGIVASKAKRANLKVISFSNNKAVAGGNVYIMGLMPDQQTVRVIKFASEHGIKSFAAVLPNNVFGNQVAELLQRQTEWVGAELRKISLYSVARPDLNISGKEVADAYKEKSVVPTRKSDAILVPEGEPRLSEIINGLGRNGIGPSGVRILGSALWDNQSTIGNSRFKGAWYASTPYEDSDSFNNRFNQNFSYKPEDIAALGYDAVSLAIQIAPSDFSDSELHRSSGFKGVKGVYKFDSANVNMRGYAIYEIEGGTARVIDPAPDHF